MVGPGRHLLLVLVCVALAGPARADEDEARKARALAAKGQRAFDRGDYDEAIQAFGAAYDTKPHFLMQCNIARCYEMKGDYKEADKRYKRCLDEGADRSPMAGQVRQAREMVRDKIPPDERDDRPPPPPPPPGTIPDRPFFAQGGMGAAIELAKVPSQLKLGVVFGYHLNRTAAGPAIAGDLQIGVTGDFTAIEVGPRFYWDIPLVVRGTTTLLLAPSAMLGYAHFTKQCIPRAGACAPARNGLSLQLGVEGRLILARRALIFFRPISVDMLPTAEDDWVFGLRYDLLFGGGAIW
jgi:hypothetical protein